MEEIKLLLASSRKVSPSLFQAVKDQKTLGTIFADELLF
jgi:hypothetical protein